MNNDNFLIEDSDLELARSICKGIETPNIRNRAVANALAADVAKKYFTEIEVDTDSGLHRIPTVLSKLDIADVYVNNCYIDIRVYFNDNELCVPKQHFENDLLPVAYMFIKLNSDISGATVTGFVLPTSIDTSKSYENYYKVSEDDLVSYYDIQNQLISSYFDEIPEDFEIKIFEYLDGKLSDENQFYSTLLKSKECRIQLKNAANAQSVFEHISETKIPVQQNISQDFDMVSDDNSDSLTELTPADDLDSSDLSFDVAVDEEELLPIDEEGYNDLETESAENEFPVAEEISFGENPLLDIEEGEEALLEENIETETLLEESLTVQELDDSNLEENANISPEIETPSEQIVDIQSPQEEISETEIAVDDEVYTTMTTPSIDSVENQISYDELENMLDTDESILDESASNVKVADENSQQIGDLFIGNTESEEEVKDEIIAPAKKGGSGILLLFSLIIIGALGYWGYTKFMNPDASMSNASDLNQVVQPKKPALPAPAQEAMPVETVENTQFQNYADESNSVSIPAIEQNLDASIMVSNLSINWEVPAGYATNNTAKRYFTKIGKIIQLNLKAELLLLSKPPITNKIAVELVYDKNASKFTVKGITASSGEKVVDDVVIRVINSALDINLKTNMSTFANISGNPVLIIHL